MKNGSVLERKWLQIIPYFQPLRLTDYNISAGVHYRTLVTVILRTCRSCGNESSLGHDEFAFLGTDGTA